jgi:5'-nucleotidase
MRIRPFLLFLILMPALGATLLSGTPRSTLARRSEDRPAAWPRTVLITNDDGIDDPGMAALARAFSEIAETYVVAPLEDRSGSAHYVSAYSKHVLQVQEHNLGSGIRAYGVDGYPGDCVLLALRGIMYDNPPDLVVSGINGGPNLGFDWLASGTIGAARLAAAWGVPAIAVSGLDQSVPDASASLAEWVTRLAGSDLVRGLGGGQYLTVSFPRTNPAEFKGVRVAERAGILLDFRFSRVQEDTTSGRTEVWALQRPRPVPPDAGASDAALYRQGYIVVVPMRADEHDRELLSRLLREPEILPGWPAPEGKK